VQTDLGGFVPTISDQPWPAFPADTMSIAIVTATQCEGMVLMHEKMFESRMFFVDKLIGMGAHIVLCDPHRAVVSARPSCARPRSRAPTSARAWPCSSRRCAPKARA
jgi:UDP-N-acetylglucosamine 1-carboxyvinyltransferase